MFISSKTIVKYCIPLIITPVLIKHYQINPNNVPITKNKKTYSERHGTHDHKGGAKVISNFGSFSALKSLGDLASLRPIIIVDTREQCSLVFTRLESVRGSLPSGDYSACGVENQLAIERKSISDLVACCANSNRHRFELELGRLRGYRYRRLLVVGEVADIEAGNYRSQIKPKSVLNSLAVWEARFDVPVVFEPTPELAALRVESWIYWYCREIVQGANELLRGNKKASQSLLNPT